MANKYKRRESAVIAIDEEVEQRYIFGAQALLRELGCKKVPAGVSWHILTGGNVDSICYVRWALQTYGHIDHLTMSVWSIRGSNLVLLRQLRDKGQIGELTLIVGDSYEAYYKKEMELLREMREKGQVSKIVIGHLHCKLLLIACGEHRLVGEGSANATCNPRVEQMVLSDNAPLYDFYQNFFQKAVTETHMGNAQII